MWALRAYLCVGTRCTPAPSEAWLYSLLLFRALHLLLTIVAWQHFFQNNVLRAARERYLCDEREERIGGCTDGRIGSRRAVRAPMEAGRASARRS